MKGFCQFGDGCRYFHPNQNMKNEKQVVLGAFLLSGKLCFEMGCFLKGFLGVLNICFFIKIAFFFSSIARS